MSSEHATTFAIGEEIGGAYRIERLLGTGGMSAVFEAKDQLLDRTVAIKVLTRPLPGQQLHDEGRALAAVHHPCMVTVHAMGLHRGLEYLVMERVYGKSLAHHIDHRRFAKQTFEIAEALEVLLKIADGLAAVHRIGFAHRDLKPDNVLLAIGSRVVLIDLGLGRAERTSIADEEVVAGSPYYIAPEIINRSLQSGHGHLVDLYALGVITYEMLVGSPPYEALEVKELLAKHVEAPIPDLRAHRPEVRPELVELVTGLLAKRPGDRPQSIESVMIRLRALLRYQQPLPGPFSVLIVDDDEALRDLFARLVRSGAPDAAVQTAASAAEAFQRLAVRVPDVMLLDFDLPDLSGLDICVHLRGTHTADRCLVISVSGRIGAPDVDLMRQLGVRHFIKKDDAVSTKIVAAVRALRKLV